MGLWARSERFVAINKVEHQKAKNESKMRYTEKRFIKRFLEPSAKRQAMFDFSGKFRDMFCLIHNAFQCCTLYFIEAAEKTVSYLFSFCSERVPSATTRASLITGRFPKCHSLCLAPCSFWTLMGRNPSWANREDKIKFLWLKKQLRLFEGTIDRLKLNAVNKRNDIFVGWLGRDRLIVWSGCWRSLP